MDTAYLVADGEGGVLGFTAARALRFRGCYVSYADVSGGGVRYGGLDTNPFDRSLFGIPVSTTANSGSKTLHFFENIHTGGT